MQYKYRFVYLFIIVAISLLLSFFYDIQPLLIEIYQLHLREAELQKQLVTQQKKLTSKTKIAPVQKNITSMLAELMQLAASFALLIQKIHFFSETKLQMILQGNINELVIFIANLSQTGSPFVLLDFYLRPIKDKHYYLDLTVRQLKYLSLDKIAHSEITNLSQAFCAARTLQLQCRRQMHRQSECHLSN